MASLDILKQSSLTEKQADLLDCAMKYGAPFFIDVLFAYLYYSSAIILKGIINDILDLSVLEMGTFKIAKEPFSFSQRVALSFGMFVDAAKVQGISYKWVHEGLEITHIPRSATTAPTSSSTSYSVSRLSTSNDRQVEYANLPPMLVVGDSRRMQQVLMNLLRYVVRTLAN